MSIRDEIRQHAELIAKDVPGVREHWFAIGALYIQVERDWMAAHPEAVRPTGKALGKVRAEAGVTPEDLGLPSNQVSSAVLLARWRKAVEVFLQHAARNAADPVRMVQDWKRWAIHIRQTEGGGKFTREVKDKYFPGIPDNEFRNLFPKASDDQDTIRKIVNLIELADDQEGTPEGQSFREKAESLADNLGLTIEEARDQYIPEPSPLEHQRTIVDIQRRLVALANKYPVGVFRAAAMYMYDRGVGSPKQLEQIVKQFNEEEC